MNVMFVFLMGRIFITSKNSQKNTKEREIKQKKRNNFNCVENQQIVIIHQKFYTEMYEKNTLLNLSSHHTVKAVQLIY